MNLVRRTSSLQPDWLLQQQLLVINQRLVPLAQQLGFLRTPWVATCASDAGLIAQLQQQYMQEKEGNR